MEQRNSPTRVLLVDDDEEDFMIVRRLVGKIAHSPFILEWVDNAADAAEAIAGNSHDIYLIDYRLGAENGLELLERFDLIQHPAPFIVLTGAGDERVERKAMRMGAADYLVKGQFDDELLSRVLRYSLQRKHMEQQRVQHLMEVAASKDEFIALASHELRTPASAVKQYLGMLMDGFAGPVPDEQMTFLRTAYDSNERQIKIVNDILMVAQLDLKKIVMHKEVLDVRSMTAGIMHDIKALSERESPATYEESDEPLMVDADPTYFRMALTNIIENAAKYTPGDRAIHVSVGRNDTHAIIVIADKGVGIAEKDVPRLFKKFSRIHNPLSVEVGGTGLGLYWANEIVRLHDGTIDVASEQAVGTTFTVTVPLA